jgi:nitrile hydratase
MNGAHDMGGMDGFGPVEIETDAPEFHAEWERRAFAITVAMGFYGRWNIDESRYARENRDPLGYLEDSYYQRWLYGLEVLLEENDLVGRDEIAARMRALAEGGS